MSSVVPRHSPELRCAFCHGSAENAEACTRCGTLVHPGCRAEAGTCVTLGCGAQVSAAEKSRSLPYPWPVVAGLGVLVVFLGYCLFLALSELTTANYL